MLIRVRSTDFFRDTILTWAVQGIVHPVHDEYYIQSQPGLKGSEFSVYMDFDKGLKDFQRVDRRDM